MLKTVIGSSVVLALIWWSATSLSFGPEGMPEDGPADLTADTSAWKRVDDRNSALSISEIAFHRANGLERLWRIEPDRRSISFLTYEDFAAGGSTYFQEFERATSYVIQEVAPRSAIEVFIQGVPRGGGFVIEQWHLNEVQGSLSANIRNHGTPIGTPSPFSASQNESYVVGGGAQILISERVLVSPPRREEFASDPNVDCAAIAADPEGRFVLVLTTAGELRQYEVGTGDGSYTVVTDATSHPSLLTVEGLMWRAQHSLHGRVWFLWQNGAYAQNGTLLPPDEWGYVVLHDVENDGVFEYIERLTIDDPILNELLDANLWVSDFASF